VKIDLLVYHAVWTGNVLNTLCDPWTNRIRTH